MRICQIGSFHGTTARSVTNADSLAAKLAEVGIDSICASHHLAPLYRVTDMLLTMAKHRHSYRIVVIHVYSGYAFWWAAVSAFLAKALRKRLVLWLHGGNLPSYSRRHPWLVASVLRRADRVLAPSGYLASAFPEHTVDIIPYELAIRHYPYRQRKVVRPKLLWLRSFNHIYNPAMAAQVIHELAEDYPDVKLIMCGPDLGDGSLEETVRTAEELGVADRIELPGKVSKERIKQLGESCDIFINTTNIDNTPVSVIEAMAMGMCVISTNVGGIPYLVTDNQDGILVEPGSSTGMADACRMVLAQPDLAGRLSHQAREKALTFDWQSVMPQWQALLTELQGKA
jgi:glycosyltransferase involved in cell wall biosynthesis